MKMMKRTILALLLVLIFCLTAACSAGKQPIALSQVEKVTVWTQTDNQIERLQSVLDIQSPMPLLSLLCFCDIIISTDPEYKDTRRILYDDRKKYR